MTVQAKNISPITVRSCHKYHFCHDKHVFVATNMTFAATKMCLLRQTFCHDKMMFDRQNIFVPTKYFCRNKRQVFVMTKDVFCHNKRVCHNKSKIVATKLVATKFSLYLSQQNVCHNKNMFAATNVILQQAYFLPQQKTCLLRQK